MKKNWIYLAPLALLGGMLFVAAGGEIVRELWNWLLPPLFSWHQLTFWQALGMLALCRILFGGFGGHRKSRFRQRLSERIEAMPADGKLVRNKGRVVWTGELPDGVNSANAVNALRDEI